MDADGAFESVPAVASSGVGRNEIPFSKTCGGVDAPPDSESPLGASCRTRLETGVAPPIAFASASGKGMITDGVGKGTMFCGISMSGATGSASLSCTTGSSDGAGDSASATRVGESIPPAVMPCEVARTGSPFGRADSASDELVACGLGIRTALPRVGPAGGKSSRRGEAGRAGRAWAGRRCMAWSMTEANSLFGLCASTVAGAGNAFVLSVSGRPAGINTFGVVICWRKVWWKWRRADFRKCRRLAWFRHRPGGKAIRG